MLKDRNFINFAPEGWEGLWRSRQQLMSVLARENRVLFVEPREFLRRVLRNFRGGDLLRPTLHQVSENLHVFRYPILAPVSGRFPIDRITRTLRKSSLIKTCKKLSIKEPIVWFSLPGMHDLAKEIQEPRLLIYHIVDEYTGYAGHTPESRERVRRQENKMFSEVDAVIVASPKLFEIKSLLHPQTVMVPNGVDYQAYAMASADPWLPPELGAIKTPRLGYSGLIGDKLDLEMLNNLARAHPHWSLIFLGEARFIEQGEAWQRLAALPNVHYLGCVEVNQVPYYVKGFQVGLMPYRRSLQSEYISPLKLYDYLASGLPIASTDIPAAREYKGYIHLAQKAEDFPAAVEAALKDTSPAIIKARRKIAAQNTWESRADQISSLIETLLAASSQKGQ